MNPVIETILAHRSVSHLRTSQLSKEQIETIVRCAQAASTSSYVQAYSIIGVTDEKERKSWQKLQEIKCM